MLNKQISQNYSQDSFTFNAPNNLPRPSTTFFQNEVPGHIFYQECKNFY